MRDKIRYTISGVLIAVGIFTGLGAVGTMDYNTENHIIQSEINLFVQCGISVAAMIGGSVLCKGAEFTLSDNGEQGGSNE